MFKVNEKLYCYDAYFKKIHNLYTKHQLPSSILFSGKEGYGKKNFITHLLFNILENTNLTTSLKNKIDKLNSLIENKNSNVRYIYKKDDSLNITIEQIREVLKYSKQSSLDGNSKFIVICNPEDLNLNAANALLKILENPPVKTFFFLITNNENKIINTVKSRCVKFKINFNFSENKLILNNLLNDYKLSELVNIIFFNKYDTPGLIIEKIFFLKNNNLEKNSILEIAVFCIDNFKKTKNNIYLKYALDFSANYFNQKLKLNFRRFCNSYDLFLYKFSDCIKYNSDFSSVLKLLKKNQ